MHTNLKTIKKNFQKSFDKYDKNAEVQRIMAKKSVQHLSGLNFENVLEIGTGTGLMTSELAQHISYKNYYSNDLVEKSEFYIKKFVPDTKFYAGDFRRIKFSQNFDLIAANAVFQWLENLEKVFDICYNLLNNDGILLFSTFGKKNYQEFRKISGLTLDYKTDEELTNSLRKNFDIIFCETFKHVMYFDNPLQILLHMKNTGVNSLSKQNWGIKEVKDFCNEYKKNFPDLRLTYEPVIIIAKRKQIS